MPARRILLFPFGQLRPRASVPFLAALPILFFLSGDAYRVTFVIFMIAGVLTLMWRLKNTPPSAAKQQIKWALLGFSGYAFFLALAFLSDMTKLNTAFGGQLTLEVVAGLSFGLAFLSLQLGLMIALLRFRLYDAKSAISRSANIALITLGVTAVFAGAADALKQIVYNYTGNNGSEGPVIIAAVLATVLVNPIQERITRWSERRFQKNLFLLRDDLPECVRDMRETASLTEMLDDILLRIERGVRSNSRRRHRGGKSHAHAPCRDRRRRGMARIGARPDPRARCLQFIGPDLPGPAAAGSELGRRGAARLHSGWSAS